MKEWKNIFSLFFLQTLKKCVKNPTFAENPTFHTEITDLLTIPGLMQLPALPNGQSATGHSYESVTSNPKSDFKIDAFLHKEHSCQISSRSDLNGRSLGLFRRGRRSPQQQQQQQQQQQENVLRNAVSVPLLQFVAVVDILSLKYIRVATFTLRVT